MCCVTFYRDYWSGIRSYQLPIEATRTFLPSSVVVGQTRTAQAQLHLRHGSRCSLR